MKEAENKFSVCYAVTTGSEEASNTFIELQKLGCKVKALDMSKPLAMHAEQDCAVVLLFFADTSIEQGSFEARISLYENLSRHYFNNPRIICLSKRASEEAHRWLRADATGIVTTSDCGYVRLSAINNLVGVWSNKLSAIRELLSARSLAGTRNAAQALAAAYSDKAVFFSGGSGVGKEFLAKLTHEHSSRASEPFLVVPCASISDSLAESELFGHTKGAFSGASTDHKGLLQAAESGTVVLDEISDLSSTAQAKLLRVLQERSFRPVGSKKEIELKAQIFSTSNQNISSKVIKGQFREDLFHRLCGLTVNTASLAERRLDIPILVRTILRKMHGEHSTEQNELIDYEALLHLSMVSWPGNVRQLKDILQIVKKQSASTESRPLTATDLRQIQTDRACEAYCYKTYRNYILQQLALTELNKGANVNELASRMHLSRSTAYRLRSKLWHDNADSPRRSDVVIDDTLCKH